LIGEFEGDRATLAILKHTNPCGVGQGEALREAWDKAYATDQQAPLSSLPISPPTLSLSCKRRKIFVSSASSRTRPKPPASTSVPSAPNPICSRNET
jgi:hypothetical protein